MLSQLLDVAGLEVTEKIDLIYFFGWVAGWVAGESGIKANTQPEFELS